MTLGSTTFGATERLGTAVLDLTVDASELEKGLDKAERTAKTKGDGIGKAIDTGAKVAAIGLLAIGAAAGKATLDASDLAESVSKTNQLFGKSARIIPGYSKSVASSFGMSRTAALDAAAGIGAMLIPMGKTPVEAAKMSRRMVELGRDLASFHNQDPTEMMQRLRSGLAGESEPLRQFGINLSDARVKAYAYKEGIADAGKELTDSQKLTARYGLAIQDAGKANGDFARTSGGLANQSRITNAQIADLSAQFGQVFIPAALAVVGVISAMVGWMTRHQTTTLLLVTAVGILATALITLSLATKAMALVNLLLGTSFTVAYGPIFAIVVVLGLLVVGFIYAWQHSETFRNIVKGVIDVVGAAIGWLMGVVGSIPGAFQAVKDWVSSNWPIIATLVSGPFAPLVALATNAFGIRSALVGAFQTAKSTVSTIAGEIPGAVWGAIKTGWAALGSVGDWFANRIGDMIQAGVTKATNAADSIGSAMMSAMKGGVNALGIQPVNRVIDAVNKLIDVVDAIIPFVSIGNVGHITAFAEGGVATAPTLALFGEDGTEVVVPVSGRRRREGRKWLSVAATMLGLPGDVPGPVGPAGFRSAMNRWGVPGFAAGGIPSFDPGTNYSGAATMDALVLAGLKSANSPSLWEDMASFFTRPLAAIIDKIPTPALTGWPLADSVPASAKGAAVDYVRGLFAHAPKYDIAGVLAAQAFAQGQMGKPYVWGGGHGGWNMNLGGYDCSGFASHVAHAAGSSMSAPGTTSSTLALAAVGARGPVEWGWRHMNDPDPRHQHMGAKVLSQWYQFGDPGHAGGPDSQWDILGVPPGLPQYASGASAIGSDGLAYLHAGEAVLNRRDADRYRAGGGVYIGHAEFSDSVSAEAVLARMARSSR